VVDFKNYDAFLGLDKQFHVGFSVRADGCCLHCLLTAVDYTALGSCGDIDRQPEVSFIACSIPDLLSPHQAILTLTYTPAVARNFEITAFVTPLTADTDTSRDVDPTNNELQTCANVVSSSTGATLSD
jgi:hypothetical protein